MAGKTHAEGYRASMPIETVEESSLREHAGDNLAVAYVLQREAVDWDFPITA